MRKLNVLIAGSTGYIGIQLVKLLVNHKNIKISNDTVKDINKKFNTIIYLNDLEHIKDDIQEGINDYIDTKEQSEKSGLGFVENQDEQLKVNISNAEVDRLIKEYKKIKKRQKSNLNQIKLLDKFGNPMK